MKRNRRNGATAQTGVPVWMLELMFLTVGALVWLLFYFILRTTIEGCPPDFPPQVTTSELAPAFPGESYNMELSKKGTCSKVKWHLDEEESAEWLEIDENTGRLSADRVPQIKNGDEKKFTAAVWIVSHCNVEGHKGPGPTNRIVGVISRRETRRLPLRVATDSLPTAIAGEEYTCQLAADGGYPFTKEGEARYKWKLIDGSDKLGKFGISLQTNGTLQSQVDPQVDPEAFTDDNEYSINLNLAVMDSRGGRDQADIELSLKKMVLEHDMEIVRPNNEAGRLSEAIAGRPFCLPLSVVGGEAPYTWSIKPSSTNDWQRSELQCDEKAGLLWAESLKMPNPDSTKTDMDFQVLVKDGRKRQTDAEFVLPIRAMKKARELEVLSSSFPTGIAGEEYKLDRLSARGGVGEYTWSAEELPTGMNLSKEGVFKGTPEKFGRHSFKGEVSDEAGGRDSFQATLQVREYDEVRELEILTPEKLPTAIVDKPFDLQFAARGGKGEKLTWEVTGDSAKNVNLQLTEGGRLESDKVKGTTNDNQIELEIAVSDEAERHAKSTFTLPLEDIGFDPEDLRILSDPQLPNVKIGSPITLALSATGGVPDYDWTAEVECHADIKKYIQLDTSGVLSINVPRQEWKEGRPAEQVRVAAEVKDKEGQTAQANFVFYVVPGKDDVPPPVLYDGELPAAIVGQSYWFPIAVMGGVPPYLCEIQGVLPHGLKFDEKNMLIHGTPEEKIEVGEFGVVVTDMRGDRAAAEYQVNVISSAIDPEKPLWRYLALLIPVLTGLFLGIWTHKKMERGIMAWFEARKEQLLDQGLIIQQAAGGKIIIDGPDNVKQDFGKLVTGLRERRVKAKALAILTGIVAFVVTGSAIYIFWI